MSLYCSFILSLDKPQFWSQPLPGNACPVDVLKRAKLHLSQSFFARVCSGVYWWPRKRFFCSWGWLLVAAIWAQGPSGYSPAPPGAAALHSASSTLCHPPCTQRMWGSHCRRTQSKTKIVAMLWGSLCLELCCCLDFLWLWENRRVQCASWRNKDVGKAIAKVTAEKDDVALSASYTVWRARHGSLVTTPHLLSRVLKGD